MPYRRDAALEERERARLSGLAAALEARWTAVFWDEVAPARGVAPRAPLEGLSDEALRARVTELERLEAELSELALAWREPPPLPPTPHTVDLARLGDFRGDPSVLGPVMHWIARAFAHYDADEDLFGIIDAVRAGAAGAPMRLALSKPDFHRSSTSVRVTLEAPLSLGVGTLTVRGETFVDEVLRAVRLRREVELGDDAFDGVAFVQGAPDVAHAVLDAAMRRRLLKFAERCEFPELSLGEGRVRMAWRHRIALGPVPLDAVPVSVARVAAGIVADLSRLPPRPLRTDD